MNIIITILMLSVLIVVHEFGHFIVARLNGVQVEEFALGMGTQLWHKQSARSGTKYSLRLLPIGGYVKMLGDEGEDLALEADPEKTFYAKSVWRRIAIIVAGPLMNFVIAILFFIIAFVGLGAPSDQPIIGDALEGGAAIAAGIQDGDRVLSVDGQAVESWQQLVQAIRDSQGQEMTLEIQRDGQQLTIQAAATLEPGQGVYLLGIQQATQRRSIFSAIQLGFTETYAFTKQILLTFAGMLTGKVEAELTGPVGMTSIVGQVAQNGLFQLLLFFGVISINLGVVNLLPLPALDGGRVVFMLIEAVRGKPLDPTKENMVHFIGLVALMGLMILITYQDIVRLITS